MVEDYAVIGTEAGFKAVVDASKGEALDKNEQFEKAVEGSEDKLGYAYVDTKALLSSLGAAGQLPGGTQLPGLLGAANQPIVASLAATAEKVTVEAVTGAPKGAGSQAAQASELLPGLPGDSWLGLGIPGLGRRQADASTSSAEAWAPGSSRRRSSRSGRGPACRCSATSSPRSATSRSSCAGRAC